MKEVWKSKELSNPLKFKQEKLTKRSWWEGMQIKAQITDLAHQKWCLQISRLIAVQTQVSGVLETRVSGNGSSLAIRCRWLWPWPFIPAQIPVWNQVGQESGRPAPQGCDRWPWGCRGCRRPAASAGAPAPKQLPLGDLRVFGMLSH